MINRVMVRADGTTATPSTAWYVYGILPDVVYVRDDGWTLGAPSHLEDVAKRLWRGRWIDRKDMVAFTEDDHYWEGIMDLHQLAITRGWWREATGGNCDAYVRVLQSGRKILVTLASDPQAPTEMGDICCATFEGDTSECFRGRADTILMRFGN